MRNGLDQLVICQRNRVSPNVTVTGKVVCLLFQTLTVPSSPELTHPVPSGNAATS